MSVSIQKLRNSLKKDPSNTTSLFKLADALRNTGQTEQALRYYSKLVDYDPDNYQALNNYGALLRHAGDIHKSHEILNRANTLLPNNHIILTNLSNTYLSMGRADLAVQAATMAATITPGFFDAREMLGKAQIAAGDTKEAVNTYKAALELRPGDANTITSIARAYHFLGENDKALEILEPLVAENRKECATVYFLAQHATGNSDQAARYIQRILDSNSSKSISDNSLASLNFCLGKHHDNKAEFDKAMHNYDMANRLSHRQYNHQETIRYFDDIIGTFTHDFMNHAQISSLTTGKPVFVVGMPRSGTSLTEKIIDSHPGAYGAGELNDIDIFVNEAKMHSPGSRFPETIALLTREQLENMGNKYLKKTETEAGSALRIVDKMPHNFVHIGFIFRLFPNATVIHCKRNPLDTCLSCYFSEFGNLGHNYAYNIDSVADYYLQYHRLMSHWEELFKDRIYTVRYESMIFDQENASRELIQRCGLQWDDSCLRFHENKRVTNTMSYNQVNKPVYSSSTNRWKNYEPYIQPMIRKLQHILET